MEVLERNQYFYKFIEANCEFIFKLSAAVPPVLYWLHVNRARLVWLLEWTQHISYPLGATAAVDSLQHQVRLYKKRQQY
jgi:hypothetical protein